MKSSKCKVQNKIHTPITSKLAIFLISYLFLSLSLPLANIDLVHADFPVASNMEVADKNAVGGNIITSASSGLVRTTVAYDKSMIGVVISNPTIVIHPETGTTKAIITGGDNNVLVSSKNGAIKKGDLITSSDIAGVGIKATQSGYVVGVALEDFPRSGTTGTQGTVLTEVNIHYNVAEGSSVGLPFLEQVGQGFLNNLKNPSDFIRLSRYMMAGLVALFVIFISFFTFARSIRNGIEAMGRNPLAKKSIQTGMVINAIIISILAIFGLAVSYLIIRFF